MLIQQNCQIQKKSFKEKSKEFINGIKKESIFNKKIIKNTRNLDDSIIEQIPNKSFDSNEKLNNTMANINK